MLLFHIRLYLSIALIIIATGSLADSKTVGVSFLSNLDHSTNRQLELTLWYPSNSMLPSKLIGGNAVFHGVEGTVDARPISGLKSLVLISHGGLRSAANSGAWFAQRLAKEGFLTVEINAKQPLTPTDALNDLWFRSTDLSHTLDVLLGHPVWSPQINKLNVASIGFYLGGTSIFMLSGTDFDEAALRSTCENDVRNSDCAWFAVNNVSLTGSDLKPMPSNLRDSRIQSHIGIEPEYMHAFTVSTSAAQKANLDILFLDKESESFAPEYLGNHIEQANRFDGFGVCKALGATILADDGGDPSLCGQSALKRQTVHDDIVKHVLEFLGGSDG